MIPEPCSTSTCMLDDQPFLIDFTMFLSQCNRMTKSLSMHMYTCRLIYAVSVKAIHKSESRMGNPFPMSIHSLTRVAAGFVIKITHT